MGVGNAMTVRLLGRPGVLLDGDWVEPRPGRAAAVLYYLAFHGGWIGRSDLVYLFWPDSPDMVARANLRGLLHRLASEPYAQGLERERARVRWPVQTDVRALHRALDARHWREAWELGRNELLAGFAVARAPEFMAWLESERAGLRGAVRRAGLRAIDAHESEGDLVRAAMVASALHHDDQLDEVALRRHVAALARAGERAAALFAFDAFRRLLGHELGIEPEAETVHLVETIRSGSDVQDRVPERIALSLGAHGTEAAGRIPHHVTGFVGRNREVDALTRSLQREPRQLLTIVGPGGVGKTRLAIEVATRVASHFEQGARFVDLAGIRDRAPALAALAAAVGVGTMPYADDVRAIAEHLEHARMLIVLDNLEHLVDVAREPVTELMARTQHLCVLATSRVRLAYPGERVVDLAGLSIEATSDGGTSDAATLFVLSARRLQADRAFSRDELEAIDRVCALVGGLPLGLELAATWLRLLNVAEIEAGLAAGARLLDATGGSTQHRHGSMRAVFDHSWSLLRAREQQALRALAVFQGGWTREAAAAVADVGMPVHLALCDASLIRRDASRRFGWHPLIEQYAGEKAAERPAEHDVALSRHAHYYLHLLAERQSAWASHEGERRLVEVEADATNLEAACRWAIARKEVRLLTEAMQGFRWLITASTRVGSYVQVVREALAMAEPGTRLYGNALVCLGAAATWRGVGAVSEEAITSLREAIDVLQRHGAVEDAAHAHRFLGMACLSVGRVAEAREVWQRARVLHETLGDAEGVTMMLNNLSDTAPTFDEAVTGLRAAIAYGLETGALFPAALASNGLGHALYRQQGASAQAAEALVRAVDLAARTGFRHVEQHSLRLLSQVQVASGDLGSAQATIASAIGRCDLLEGERALQDLLAARAVQAWVAWLAGDQGLAQESARAALQVAGALPPGPALRPPASMELAHVVLGRVALDRGDTLAAAGELAHARAWRSRMPRVQETWHDAMGEEPDAIASTRLLAADAELALATGRGRDARDAAVEALAIASRSEQGPAATVALVVAAGVLAAGGELEVVRAALAFVRQHPATPLEALRLAERLASDRPDLAGLGADASGADGGVGRRTLTAIIDDALVELRGSTATPNAS